MTGYEALVANFYPESPTFFLVFCAKTNPLPESLPAEPHPSDESPIGLSAADPYGASHPPCPRLPIQEVCRASFHCGIQLPGHLASTYPSYLSSRYSARLGQTRDADVNALLSSRLSSCCRLTGTRSFTNETKFQPDKTSTSRCLVAYTVTIRSQSLL